MRREFDPRGPFNNALARGHYARKGHVLTGYYVETQDVGIVRLVRTCCND